MTNEKLPVYGETGPTVSGLCEWCYGPLSGLTDHIEHYRALHQRIAELMEKGQRLTDAYNRVVAEYNALIKDPSADGHPAKRVPRRE